MEFWMASAAETWWWLHPFHTYSQINMKLAITPSGRISALLSSTGRIYQYGSRVEIVGFGKDKLVNK